MGQSTFEDFVAALDAKELEGHVRSMFGPNQPIDDSDLTFAAALIALRMELLGEKPDGTEWDSPGFLDAYRQGAESSLSEASPWDDQDPRSGQRRALAADFIRVTRPRLKKKKAGHLDDLIGDWPG